MSEEDFISEENNTAQSGNAGDTGDANEGKVRERHSMARVLRLYDSKSGPLMAWLLEERAARGQTVETLCAELGVTAACLQKLYTQPESQQDINFEFAERCARYLGVPPFVVRVLANQITIRDFIRPSQSEEEVVDRSLRRVIRDPDARPLLPADPMALPLAVKQMFLMLCAEVLGTDLFGLHLLPGMLQWLEPAVQVHFSNETAARLRAIASRPPRAATGG